MRPLGTRYRYLTVERGIIYWKRLVRGKVVKVSCKTKDWEEAAACRVSFEKDYGITDDDGVLPTRDTGNISFAVMARRTIEEGSGDLAPSSLRNRRMLLAPEARICRFFGEQWLDSIQPKRIGEFWRREIQDRGLSHKTGLNYLNEISAVFYFASQDGVDIQSPVETYRKSRKGRGGKKARAARDPKRSIRPLTVEEMDLVIHAARSLGKEPAAIILVGIDAGLRLGEIRGLRWEHVGMDTRVLNICESHPQGGEAREPPKSGEPRDVQISRRLLVALGAHRVGSLGEGLVFPTFHPQTFRKTLWQKVLQGAGIGHRMPKDMRDTYGSWLLSCAVPIGYVSKQMGHANIATTLQHYARYIPTEYRRPPVLRKRDVPADLLSRLDSLSVSTQTARIAV